MILLLQDSVTSADLGEKVDPSDFVPAVGETFIYNEGLPGEVYYTVTKRLVPTLVRASVKVVRLRVRVAG